MGPDSFVGTANLGQSPARSARRSNPVRRRKGSSERVDRIGSILPARETALRCGSPAVSRAAHCAGLTARADRKRVVAGKSGSVRVGPGGSRTIQKNTKLTYRLEN